MALLVQSQQKKCLIFLTDFSPAQKVLQTCFPALSPASCWGWLLSPKPVADSARRRLKEDEEEEGARGIAWLFLPFCGSVSVDLGLQQLSWVPGLQGSAEMLQSLSRATPNAV